MKSKPSFSHLGCYCSARLEAHRPHLQTSFSKYFETKTLLEFTLLHHNNRHDHNQKVNAIDGLAVTVVLFFPFYHGTASKAICTEPTNKVYFITLKNLDLKFFQCS